MMLRPVVESDLEKIKNWISQDPYHKDDGINPEHLMTGHGLLSFRIEDNIGTICFVRLDADNNNDKYLRIACQFGPESEVNKRRLVVGMARIGIPAVFKFARNRGFIGVIFESESPRLISFMKRFKFESIGRSQYAMTLEDK